MNIITVFGAAAGGGVLGIVGFLAGGAAAWVIGENNHHKTAVVTHYTITALAIAGGGWGGWTIGNNVAGHFSVAEQNDPPIVALHDHKKGVTIPTSLPAKLTVQ